MKKVTLRLPTNLLRRFRELASTLLYHPTDVLDGEDGPSSESREVHFHEALAYAVAEAMRAYPEGSRMEGPPATLVPCLDVESVVPPEAIRFLAQLARRSGLTLEQAWHRVVLDFCERSEAPGLGLETRREAA